MKPDLRELDLLVSEKVLGVSYLSHEEPSPYTKDIRYAWRLIEKLSHFAPVVFKCGGYTMLGEMTRPQGGEWGCRFDCAEDGKENYVLGYGDTAAEAICRAALAVVERVPR